MKKALLLSFFTIALSVVSFAQFSWSAFGTGMNSDVYAVAEYNGELYAGGNFTMVGNQQANHIAKWNGSSWQQVGGGLNAKVWCLTVYNGELYAGGFFNFFGYGIARWNGTNWQDVGYGMDDIVYAMCVYNGKLFVGGKFTMAGSVVANHIAAWDGSSWSTLGTGTDGATPYVLALTEYQNKLVVGGEFTSAGGFPAHYIASWNDTVWASMGPSTSTENWPKGVYSLCSFNNELYAGGNLDTIGLTPVQNLGQWNGLSWTNPGMNINNPVYAMITDGSSLVVGGYFTVPEFHIFSWDGSATAPLGVGLNNYVTAFCFFNGHLAAAGAFTASGITAAKRIAYWTAPMGTNEFKDVGRINVFPNPGNGDLVFQFSAHNSSRRLEVFSCTGALVDQKVLDPFSTEVTVDETELSEGIYIYRLLADGKVTGTGKLVITGKR